MTDDPSSIKHPSLSGQATHDANETARTRRIATITDTAECHFCFHRRLYYLQVCQGEL